MIELIFSIHLYWVDGHLHVDLVLPDLAQGLHADAELVQVSYRMAQLLGHVVDPDEQLVELPLVRDLASSAVARYPRLRALYRQ